MWHLHDKVVWAARAARPYYAGLVRRVHRSISGRAYAGVGQSKYSREAGVTPGLPVSLVWGRR